VGGDASRVEGGGRDVEGLGVGLREGGVGSAAGRDEDDAAEAFVGVVLRGGVVGEGIGAESDFDAWRWGGGEPGILPGGSVPVAEVEEVDGLGEGSVLGFGEGVGGGGCRIRRWGGE